MKTSRKLLYGALATLICLIGLEGVCRLMEGRPKYVPSDLLGFELTPGYRGRRERVNELGLRGPEIEAQKAPGTFRILAAGGSTTYGHKMGEDETWPAILEQRLRELGWTQVEVLNGGVPGWGLEQIALDLERRRVEELDPDLVLVYSGWNDPVRDNPLARSLRKQLRESPESDWLHAFAVVRFLEKELFETAQAKSPDVEKWRRRTFELQARRRVELPELVDRLANLARQRGFRLAFVELPGVAQLPRPDSRPKLRRRYDELLSHQWAPSTDPEEVHRLAVDEYLSAIEPVAEAASRRALPYLELAARMQESAASDLETWLTYFRDRMHLTARGNQAIAEELVELLREHSLLPPQGAG